MAKTDFQSVDDYIATFPKAVQTLLRRVRSTIRKAVPGAVESISYQIPAYKVAGFPVLFFAGWKQHYSLYPITGAVAREFATELVPYAVSKGTARFSFDEAVPVTLIERIAKRRAKEGAEHVAAKAANKKATKKKATKKKATKKT